MISGVKRNIQILQKLNSIMQQVQMQTFAVGIPYLSHNFFMKSLDPSSAAASEVGPKAGIPALTRSFTRPATNGASGPTTTSPTSQLRQKASTAAQSEIFRSDMHVASPD